MKYCLSIFFVCILNLTGLAQCKYLWAHWNNTGLTDSAFGFVNANGTPIGMTMTANFNFDFTPNIFSYNTFNGFPDLPTDTVVPRTTWAVGAGGQTTVCFSQPVTNPVLLLASLGNVNQTVVLNFSIPYSVLFDGGGTTYNTNTSLTALEGFCIIEFPGTFTCLTIFSSTPEFYTNLTWGIKNPLKAGFSFTQLCQGANVNFSSASTSINPPGTIIGYDWTFGDNDTSLSQNPTHQYANTGTYNVQLIVTSDNLCTDTISHMVNIVPVVSANNPQSICSGSAYIINTHQYTTAGTYYDTLTTPSGCDSIVITTLSITPAIQQTNNISICAGLDYVFNSHVYNNPGTYYDTLHSPNTCDSIIITNLSVTPSSIYQSPVSICPGASYTYNAHTYSQPGSYTDTLTSITGCDSIINTILSFTSPPLINFSAPADLCISDAPVLLNAIPAGGIMSGAGISNNYFDPQQVSPGASNIAYIYTDANGCFDTATSIINVHPLPTPEFSTNPTIAHIDHPLIAFTDLTSGTSSCLWDFGDHTSSSAINPDHTYGAEGMFEVTLTVTDQFGCINSTYHTIEIRNNFSFYISNSFSPNKDGINDYFNGFGVGIDQYKMSIFNRWGLKVFETNNLNVPWTGGDYPQDTYVYRVELTDYDNNAHEYVGKVTVVR